MSIPEFKRPELEDRELITSYFEKAPSRSCERTFVNVYLWSRHYRVKYAVIGDALVFRSDENGTAFAYPAGEKENIRRAVGYLTQYCKDRGIPLVFYNVTPEMFSQLEEWYPGRFTVEYNRDYADYVYETEKLATLAGKELGLKGGVLKAGGRIVAFTVGEPLCDDTFVVHIEKAFPDVDGAYPMINQQFVQHECMDYKYVNREEDTGAEGLRKAKLSYKPAFLEEKGVVKEME